MNRLIAAIKKLRLSQILMTCVAGILLFVSTACSSVQAKSPDSGAVTGRRQEVPAGKLAVPGQKNPRPEIPGGTATSPSRDVINKFEGGPTMNEFSDVDPRARDLEKSANRQAEALKENAARNIEAKSVDSPQQYGRNYREGTPFGERVKNLGEDIGSSAKELTEGVSKGTQRGIENIKGNTADAAKGAGRAAEDVKDTTSGQARDLTKSAKRAVENTSQSAQRNLDRAGNAIQDRVD